MTDEIVLLSKSSVWCQHAGALAQAVFGDRIHWIQGRGGERFPHEALEGFDGLLVSFLCPWVVPSAVLERAGLAINFHPGSSSYPGAGCYNFALYEGASHYGAVCHRMAPVVDSGEILIERLFPVFPEDSVETLKLRTMATMLAMFHEMLGILRQGSPLPRSEATWQRKPFRARDIDALCRLSPDMTAEEITRRVRATTYPGFPGAVMRVHRTDFAYPIPTRPPLA